MADYFYSLTYILWDNYEKDMCIDFIWHLEDEENQ